MGVMRVGHVGMRLPQRPVPAAVLAQRRRIVQLVVMPVVMAPGLPVRRRRGLMFEAATRRQVQQHAGHRHLCAVAFGQRMRQGAAHAAGRRGQQCGQRAPQARAAAVPAGLGVTRPPT